MPRLGRGLRKGALARKLMIKGLMRAAVMGAVARKGRAKSRFLGGNRLRGFR